MRIGVGIIILGLILGIRYYEFFEKKPDYQNGQQVRLHVILQEEPELSNRGQRFGVKDGYNQRIYVTTASFPRLHYGDRITVAGSVERTEGEDGRRFLRLYYPQIQMHAFSENGFVAAAHNLREKSKNVFESTLPPTSASLLMGIVFGAKEQFPEAFFADLQATGVLHVIAASGMNVTFIAAGLLFTLGSFLRRQIALLIGAAGIIFYVFLVGFEPSIIRASLMALLAFGTSLLGRQHFAACAVGVSAYIMLLWQPGFLFDLGFQLSFLATLGILYIKPLLDQKLSLMSKIGGETINTTLAAQIATTPLLIGVFGQIGIMALLVNALVLWTVPIIMLLGSLASLTQIVLVPIAQLFTLLCLPFLWFFETLVTFFGQSFGTVELGSVPWMLIVSYYVFLLSSILLMKPKVKAMGLEESLALEKY